MSPIVGKDDIQSVTLKSFRKVVGYDTFNSILRKNRDEKKDPSDYYNVTVSMLIRRHHDPIPLVQYNNEGKSLADVLDKGFPYDDADIDFNERARQFKDVSVK